MPGIDRFHPLHAFAICNENFSFSVVWVFISCILWSSPELCYRLELWGRFYFMSVVFLFAKINKIAQNNLQKIKKDTSQAHIYICACNIHIRVHHKFKVIYRSTENLSKTYIPILIYYIIIKYIKFLLIFNLYEMHYEMHFLISNL